MFVPRLVSRRVLTSCLFALAVVVGTSSVAMAVPANITQQGRLLDDGGKPLTGSHTLHFTLYDAASSGATLWEGEVDVDLGDSGFYSVVLGSESNPLDKSKLQGDEAWLGLSVDGGDEMSPRLQITSVPYALVAGRADSVADGSVTSSSLAPGAVTDATISSVAWTKISGVPSDIADGDDDVLGGMSCQAGQVAQFDGTDWVCATAASYDGSNFATSDQMCNGGQVATGIDAAGQLVCADDANDTYDGTDFALSDQACANGQVAVGLDASGALLCQPDADTTYDGTDFATSAQSCAAGQMAIGIDANGQLVCDDAPTPWIPGGPANAQITKITVSAKGTCGTSATKPQLALYINRELVNVIAIPNSSYSNFDFPINATYAGEIGVGFINDGMSGSCDRNLSVESITINDTITVPSTDDSKVFLDKGTFFDNKDVAAATDTLTTNSVLRFMIAPQAIPSVPSGMIAFFPGNCPPGWSEYTKLRGRVAVGMPSGGTAEATVDMALTDQGKRVITQVPAHTHTIDPPATWTTTDGAHSHGIPTYQDDYNVSGGVGPSFGGDNGTYGNHGNFTQTAGAHRHLVDIPPFPSNSTGPPSVDVSMPYVQLRACQAP